MSGECERFTQLIPRAVLDDLEPASRVDLEKHLAECETCRAEQLRCLGMIDQLVSVEDVPVPRHFFVSPDQAPVRFLSLFARLIPSWKFAAAAFASIVLVVGLLAVTHFQFKAENGVYAFSFGRPLPDLDASGKIESQVEAVRQELTRLLDERIESERKQYLATLKAELKGSARSWNSEQRRVLQAALRDVEMRMNGRLESTGSALETKTGRTLQTMYDALQVQRAQDLTRIRASMTQAALKDEQKELETRAVLATLIEVADLKVRGNN